MSAIRLNRFVALAGRDPAYRRALQNLDAELLADCGITDEQIAALAACDTGRLVELGLRPGLCMGVTVLRTPEVVIRSGDAAEYFPNTAEG